MLILNVFWFFYTVCEEKIDLVFLLDKTKDISNADFETMKEFIKALVNQFKIGDDFYRIGLVSFARQAQIEFDLNTYSDRTDILNDIMAVTKGALKKTRTGRIDFL